MPISMSERIKSTLSSWQHYNSGLKYQDEEEMLSTHKTTLALLLSKERSGMKYRKKTTTRRHASQETKTKKMTKTY